MLSFFIYRYNPYDIAPLYTLTADQINKFYESYSKLELHAQWRLVIFCDRQHIFVQFGGLLFLQTIGFATNIYCASLFLDLFLHAYDSDFLQGLLKNKDRKLAKTLISSFHYKDDVLSLNTSRFGGLSAAHLPIMSLK
jgi:hypothetical protein